MFLKGIIFPRKVKLLFKFKNIHSFRFEGVVQGKELDAILSDQDLEEGEHLAEELMEENEELDTDETAVEVILFISTFCV